METFTYTNPKTGKEKTYSSTEIARLSEIADNDTEYAKFINAAKTDDDRNKRIDVIKEFKFQRGDDLSRLSPQAALGILDSAGFGYGIEGVAGISAAIDALRGKSSFMDAYEKYRDFAEDERDRFADKYGGQALVGDLAGGLLTGGTLLKGAKFLNPFKDAKNIFGKGASLATEGAALGAIYGSGYDSDARKEGALYGAALGGALNPITVGGLQGIAKIAEPGVEAIGRNLTRAGNVVTERVTNPIRKALGREELPPETVMEDQLIRESLQNLTEVGGGRATVETNLQGGMPLASNPNIIAEARPVLQTNPKWTEFTEKVFENRDNALKKAYDTIIPALGNLQDRAQKPNELFVDFVKRVSKENTKAARQLYEDAALGKKLEGTFVSEISAVFNNPVFNQLSPSAKRSLQAITVKTRGKPSGVEGKTVRAFNVDENGLSLNDGVTFADIDHLAIDRVFRSLRDSRKDSFKFGGDRVDGDIISDNNLLNDVDNILSKYSDDIRDIRASYSKNFNIDDASNDGYKLYNKEKPEAFLSRLRELTEEGDQEILAGFVRGYMRKVSELLRGSGKKGFLRRLGDDDSNDAEMFRAIFPDESVDDVVRQINETNEFVAAASKIEEKPFTAQQTGREKRGTFGDKITKDTVIQNLINNALPQDLNPRQKQRLMNLLLERAPKNITDNLDKPGYPELFNEFIRRNIPAQIGIAQQQ